MSVFDPKLRLRPRRYAGQVLLATLSLVVVLWAAELLTGPEVAHAVMVAAVASTAFVLFVSPQSAAATPRHVLGGHAIALVIGSVLAALAETALGQLWLSEVPALFAVDAAVSVGASMFAMASTNTEHAPAAGTALGVVAHGFSWALVVFVTIGVVMLATVHWLLRSRLEDLY